MDFAGINYVAVPVAAVAGFAVGMGWYMTLGNAWMAALGKTKDELKPSAGPFIVSGISLIVMAAMLAGVIGHLGKDHVTLINGAISGLFIWLGFVITTMATNHAYQVQKRNLTLIDGGHYLVVLIVMGAIIGWFGV
ncbi:MAG: DUF1761 domain-containing protein [Hyphomicrobiales bacterium]|nr:DUF1761 domain-containing protein [Hyphomicrobiales bacterium]